MTFVMVNIIKIIVRLEYNIKERKYSIEIIFIHKNIRLHGYIKENLKNLHLKYGCLLRYVYDQDI